MNVIEAILAQSAGATRTAQTGAVPDGGDAALFASLLAGQQGQVQPVPRIAGEASGQTPDASSTPADTSILAILAHAGQSGSGQPASVSANASPTTETPAASGTGETSQPAGPADSVSAAATQGDSAGQAGEITSAAKTAPDAAARTANAAAGQTGGEASAKADGQAVSQVTVPAAANATDAAAKPANNKAANATPGQPPASAEGEAQPAATAAKGQSGSVAPANANTAAAAQTANTQTANAQAAAGTVPAATAQPQAEAGVQARRDAAVSKTAPASGHGAAKSPASTPQANSATPPQAQSTAAKPDIAPPPPNPAPPPLPAGETPAEAVRAPLTDAARANANAAADPVDGDTALDGERVDMSTLRSADAARHAERPGSAAGTARFTPANAGSLAAQIAARFQNGERRFEIRMDPPELGRVEVRLHVGHDNRVQAMLSAERPETLNDMRQYARELERALEEAGLQLDNDGLSFELSQGSDQEGETPSGNGRFSTLEFAEDLAGPVTAAASPSELYGFRLMSRPGLDMRL